MDARYRGTCADCEGLIEIGDSIHRVDEERYAHDICPPDVETDVTGQPCPECHLHHRGECF